MQVCVFHHCVCSRRFLLLFFFFTNTATTVIYTLSLHDALPISRIFDHRVGDTCRCSGRYRKHIGLRQGLEWRGCSDRKSTRLNSSHVSISYAVFCLKKKKEKTNLKQSCNDNPPRRD